jgi:hypothetical protein
LNVLYNPLRFHSKAAGAFRQEAAAAFASEEPVAAREAKQ